jgi:hypothetical protein
MVGSMLDCGLMENSMEEELLWLLMGKKEMENGIMGRGQGG